MKKLALALVCLVSVAFFASCDPITNPEPSITVVTGEDYLYDGEVIELGVEYPFAFRAASNAQTLKPLARMEITCTAGENVFVVCDTTISGTEFVYEGAVFFQQQREIVGSAEITAKVTDAAGETATATIKVDIENVDTLEPTDFSWVRRGANLQGDTEEIMAALGLKWYDNHKEVFATIKPLNENCKMYILIDNDAFETVTTDTEMAAFFSNLQENTLPALEYRHVTANASADYNDILAVIAEDGTQYLVHITHADIETGSFGTQISISGQFK